LLDVNHVLSIDELSALVHVDASATAVATESA
jgi:hypothetical protein